MLPYQIPPCMWSSLRRRRALQSEDPRSPARLSYPQNLFSWRLRFLLSHRATSRLNLTGHSGWFENCCVALREDLASIPVGSRELAFEFGYDLGSSRFGQYLTMPALKTFNAEQPLALQCPREHDRGTIDHVFSRFKGCNQVGDAVSINQQCLPTECFPASLVDFEIPLQHGRLALPKPVDVDDRAKIVEAAKTRPLRGLPNRAFGRFAIAH